MKFDINKLICSAFRGAKLLPNGRIKFERFSVGPVNLVETLSGEHNRKQIERLRAARTPEEKARIKLSLPFLTPSMLLKKGQPRQTKSDFIHTGALCIDIDSKQNPHVLNFGELKPELAKISNVAAVFTSASGNGYFLIIYIAYPERHKEHFAAVQKFFSANGLTIDPACKDVTRPRFVTYDPNPVINPNAEILFTYLEEPKKERKPRKPGETGPNIFEAYNATDQFIEVLEKHGWTIQSEKGTKIFFTRPGKDPAAGCSAEFDYNENVFFCFSSNAEPFVGNIGYNPFQVYSLLEHEGDTAKAARELELIEEFSNIEI